MPNNRLFTVYDSNLERSQSDLASRLFIPPNDEKKSTRLSSLFESLEIQESGTQTITGMAQQKQIIRRPRSQTLPDITTQRRDSTKRIETPGSLITKTPLRLTRSLELDSRLKNEPKAASPVRKRSRSLHPNQAKVSFDTALTSRRSSMKESQKFTYKLLSKERPSIDITSADHSGSNTAKSRSFSIPNGDMNSNSIYSIVKARSLALKWYRNNGGSKGVMTRARRKRSVPLPTIMDEKKNISLCKAKCSPQFEQVVHWLRDEVDNIEDDIQVLSLE